jgi:hypothetical protein
MQEAAKTFRRKVILAIVSVVFMAGVFIYEIALGVDVCPLSFFLLIANAAIWADIRSQWIAFKHGKTFSGRDLRIRTAIGLVSTPLYLGTVGCIAAVFFREMKRLDIGLYLVAALLPVVFAWYALIRERLSPGR